MNRGGGRCRGRAGCTDRGGDGHTVRGTLSMMGVFGGAGGGIHAEPLTGVAVL